MKVHVDPIKCQGHLRCLASVPDVFEEDEQGHAFVALDVVPTELEDDVERAVLNCPEEAIVLDEG
jgi:ferredoxin